MAKLIKPDEDAAQASHRTLSRLIDLAGDGETEDEPSKLIGKDPAAVAMGSAGGKAGGKKGGKARAKALSDERRSEIAKKAAKARWAKRES